MVNWAPPSGQFSAQTGRVRPPAVRARSTGPCRCPRRRLRGGAAVETIEQVRQVGRRDAWAVIAHLDRPAPRRSRARVTLMVEPGGAYWAAFSSRCASAVAVNRGSSRTGTSGSTLTRPYVAAGLVDLVARRGDDLRRMRPAVSVAIAPVSIRAISRMFWKSRVSRWTSARIRSALLQPVVGGQPRGLDVGRGDADRGERRAQIVAERRQQRRFQLLALAGQLRRLALLEKLRPFDRDRHDARQSVERTGFNRPAGRSEQTDGPGAHAQGHEPNRAAIDLHRPVAGVGAGVGVELERGLGRREAVGELTCVERDRDRAGLEAPPTRPRAAVRSRRIRDRTGARSTAPAR